MTNTASLLRTVLAAAITSVVLTVLAAFPLYAAASAPTFLVMAPAEDTVSSTWECLLDLDVTGDPTDGLEALYPTREQLELCD